MKFFAQPDDQRVAPGLHRMSGAHASAALGIGTIALLVVGLQPILLGELVDAHRASLEGAGLVAMAEIVALGLGVLIGDMFVPLRRLRLVTIVGAMLAVLFDLATLRTSGDLALAAVRAGAGVSEGLLLWIATGVIVRCAKPDRVAGIFFVVQTIAQAGVGLLLANSLIPRFGWQGAFEALAAISASACVLTTWQPDSLEALQTPAVSGFRWSARTIAPLVVVFLQLAALGSLWAFVEPLGRATGFDARSIQSLIAGVLAIQVIGGSIGSVLVRLLPPVASLLVGSAVLGASAVGLHQAMIARLPAEFALLCAVFGFVWLFLMPFQTALAFRADPSGRVASLSPAMQLFGIACGPLVASFFIHGDDASSVPSVSVAFAVAAGATLLLGLCQPRASLSITASSR